MSPRLFLNVFNRYATRHGTLSRPGFPLLNRAGRVFGYIEAITVTGGRLKVDGWVMSDRVGLGNAEQTVEAVPSLARGDVLSQFAVPEDTTPGFRLDLSMSGSHTSFWTEHDGEVYVFALPGITRRDMNRLRLSQLGPFTRDVMRAVPAGLHWAIHRDLPSAARIKTALGLNSAPRSSLLNKAAFAPVPPADGEAAPEELPALSELPGGQITIILPVYNGFDLLPEVLDRVLSHTDLPWQLVLIEDRSSDARVRPFLRDWLAGLDASLKERVMLVENEANLGFIGSVNRGLAAAIKFEGHAVLLNADAFVPEGWASKLIRPMLVDRHVASVTPMSNDAEIFNVPVICQRNDLAPGQVDRINALASDLLGTGELVDTPTGVGFCMAMNIDYLRVLPTLDTEFGKGYGEEVDWCQRARQRGGRNIGLGSLFVEHRGGTSFGSEEKQKLIRRNGLMISRRYPYYDNQVQEFIGSDPFMTSRLAMAVAWAGSRPDAEVLVYLVHDMGGGAEHYVARRAAEDVAAGNVAIMLRVGGMSRWQVELLSEFGVTRGETNDTDLVRRMLNILPKKTVIYSCGVGARDPLEVPPLLRSLARGDEDRVEILFHDYFAVSPDYTLLGADGIYRGVPSVDSTDPTNEYVTAKGRRISLAEWRKIWGRLLDRADVIRVFSQNSRDIVQEAYPEQAAKIVVTPHELLHRVPRITPAKKAEGAVPVIGVLGNIGLQKGAAVLRDLSTLLARNKQAKLVVLGNVDPAYPLAAPAKIHGSYQVRDIPGLVSRYEIDCWLIPSIGPETFSFTTHEALATGMPVWSFDLGAQAEATARVAAETGQGGIMPLPKSAADLPQVLTRMFGQGARA